MRISVRQTPRSGPEWKMLGRYEEWKLLQVLNHPQYEEMEDISMQGGVINMTDPCLPNGPVRDPQLPRGGVLFGRRICRSIRLCLGVDDRWGQGLLKQAVERKLITLNIHV